MTTPVFPSPRIPSAGLRQAALALSLGMMVPGCGGGGGSAASPAAPAPTGLAYPLNPAVYVKGSAIAANTPTVASASPVSFTVTPPLPPGLTLSPATGALTGTPTAVSATATYAVRATNAGGSVTANLALTVNDVAPAFDYASTDLVIGKDAALPPLTPTSTGGAVVAWSITPALPAGLALNPATGVLSGTPTAAAAPQAYTVTATNSGGTLGKQLNLTVIGAAPVIATFAAPAGVTMGDPVTLTWATSGDPASALDINGAGLPLSQSGTSQAWPLRRTNYTFTATNLKGASQASLSVAARGLDLLAGNVDGPGWRDGTGSAARFNQPQGAVADAAGNLYISDSANHTIRKITPAGIVTTFAGRPGESGSSDGAPGGFRNPAGLAIDGAGNVYVADANNQTLRKVTPAGVVSTLAGSAGSQGSVDGTGPAARFRRPIALAVTPAGDLIVADFGNHLLRKVTPAGGVTTLAGGAGLSGSADGIGAAARFNYPSAVVAHPDGDFYVTDYLNHTLRKVTSGGVVTTLAGSAGLAATTDGTGASARFYVPRGLTVDGAGDLWVSDANAMLRKVTPAGVVTTAAGAPSIGWVDGPAASARFYAPSGLAFLPSGKLAIADEGNHAVRLLDMALGLSTFAGAPPRAGLTDGFGTSARFADLNSVVVAASGDAFVADYGNSCIRRITPTGQTTTFAGPAGLAGPTGLALDAAGNLYVTDGPNQTLLKVTPAGVVSTLAGLSGVSGSADGTGSAARFYYPSKVAADGTGNLYVTDSGNQTIRKVTPAGVVTTLAGSAGNAGLADGNGATARFNMPSGIAVDGLGNLFVGDLNNNRIRKVTPSGEVTTLALSTFIYGPAALAFDGAGTLHVADAWGHAVFTVDTATGNTALLLGTPSLPGAFTGPFPAGLNSPTGLAFTPQGDLLVTTLNGLMLATAP
ncbi:MAG: putative Ig domain-containing protein [Acidobacteria bacterium]|nr:putative Ig domain-containing protein [Acidobacteriota bacterium]